MGGRDGGGKVVSLGRGHTSRHGCAHNALTMMALSAHRHASGLLSRQGRATRATFWAAPSPAAHLRQPGTSKGAGMGAGGSRAQRKGAVHLLAVTSSRYSPGYAPTLRTCAPATSTTASAACHRMIRSARVVKKNPQHRLNTMTGWAKSMLGVWLMHACARVCVCACCVESNVVGAARQSCCLGGGTVLRNEATWVPSE